MQRTLGTIAFGLGGLLVSLILRQPTDALVFTQGFGGSQSHVLYDSVVATATAGVIVAVLVAAYITRRASLVAATVVGLGVIALVSALGGTTLAVQYAISSAAGVVLGGLARLSWERADPTRHPSMRGAALATGAIVGLLLSASVRQIRFSDDKPRRYADYVQGPHVYLTGPSDLAIALLAALALACLVGYLATGGVRTPFSEQRPSRMTVIGGCLLPVAALVAHWLLQESVSSGSGIGLRTWAFGYLLLAAALVLALLLRGRSGLLWVAVTAVAACHAMVSSLGSDAIVVLIALALALIGAVVGWRVAQPLWGIVVLGACTLLAFTGESMATVVSLIFVVPMAAAFTVLASLSPSETVTASALGTPTVLMATVGVQYGWTAYTPLTDVHAGLDFFTVPGDTTLVFTAISLAACAMVAVIITRRSPSAPLFPRHAD